MQHILLLPFRIIFMVGDPRRPEVLQKEPLMQKLSYGCVRNDDSANLEGLLEIAQALEYSHFEVQLNMEINREHIKG